jgi:hypothetical protein
MLEFRLLLVQGTPAMTDPAKPVAENVAALLSELGKHRQRVDQALAREEREEARDAHSARRQDTRRKIILGGAVVAEAKADPEFARLVTSILKRRVIDPRDRLLLALDIDQLPEAVGLPSPAEFDAMAAARTRPKDEPKH